MENRIYHFRPEKKVLKQGFFMEDEEGNIVYEAKVLKSSLLGPATFEFVNHVSGGAVQHTVGKTVTTSTESVLMPGMFKVKSGFKYDGVNIWKYLHESGITIESDIAGLSMEYRVLADGEEVGYITGMNRLALDVTASEHDLDTAFLVAFAIARTEQVFYE